MKMNSLKTIIVFFLLICCGGIFAQTVPVTGEKSKLDRINDRMNVLQIAKFTKNVDNTDTHDRNLLMYAASNGYTEACRVLIRRGSDPDLQALDGATAILYAAFGNHPRIVKLLLKKERIPICRQLTVLPPLWSLPRMEIPK